MKRLALGVVVGVAALAVSLSGQFGGASADTPCKVDCEPVIISPNPNPGESIIGPVIVVPDIVSIIAPVISFEAAVPDPCCPEIIHPEPNPGP